MNRPLVVIGDALLDRDLDGAAHRLCPDAPVPVIDDPQPHPRPGGAGLAALLAAEEGDGVEVVLVTALGDDDAGHELHRLLDASGVTLVEAELAGPTPEKVRVRADGQAVVRIDRGASRSAIGALPPRARSIVASAQAVLVSDYGRGMSGHPEVRELLSSLDRRVPVVWDPHPRGPEPTLGTRLATPSDAEARSLAGQPPGLAGTARAAAALAGRWGSAVAVTLGERGALVSSADGPPLVVPARPAIGDPCGAGDCFAAGATLALATGAIVPEAVELAVEQASAFVARGGAAGIGRPVPRHAVADRADDAVELAEQIRNRGGTVAAAGGCFDVLHSGHVRYLEAARRLGDALVVCLNSDASVRRLKGPGRPLLPEADRVTMLRALECVDAVLVFDGDTPVDALRRLRPHVFAKGADYRGADLPEAGVLSQWNGQVVVLPYVDGRSTTRLIDQMAALALGEPRNGRRA